MAVRPWGIIVGMTVRQRLDRWHLTAGDPAEAKTVAVALPLTLFTIVITPLVQDSRWGVSASVMLIGGSALLTLNRSGVRKAIRRPASAIVVLAALVAATTNGVAAAATPSTRTADYWLHLATLVLFALLLLLTPAVMVLRLLMRQRITLDTVAGALTAYLQVGIFFAVLYRLVDLVGGGDFFAQGPMPVGAFQYYSFITLTTVGYGDLTPGTSTGQLLASLEALTGQLFLVSIVALVVSNLGRDLPRRGRAGGDEDGRSSMGPDGGDSNDPATA